MRIKVRIKQKELPDLKGIDICQTIYKDFAKEIRKSGEAKHWYRQYNPMGAGELFVGVIEYQNKTYFYTELDGNNIINCTQM